MKRVLVVDDEPTVRALNCAGLEAFDLEVTAVADGDAALACLGDVDATPDLILLDVGLPGMNGVEVMNRVRSMPSTAAVPVLLLTGLEPTEETSANGVVQKPFKLETLRTQVEFWLGN